MYIYFYHTLPPPLWSDLNTDWRTWLSICATPATWRRSTYGSRVRTWCRLVTRLRSKVDECFASARTSIVFSTSWNLCANREKDTSVKARGDRTRKSENITVITLRSYCELWGCRIKTTTTRTSSFRQIYDVHSKIRWKSVCFFLNKKIFQKMLLSFIWL